MMRDDRIGMMYACTLVVLNRGDMMASMCTMMNRCCRVNIRSMVIAWVVTMVMMGKRQMMS